jgi:dTDP-4-amino-4,6-dideoxygalactose transaminase
MPKIPFLDLVTLHAELKDELLSVFSRALDTAGFIGGPMVEEFERNFAAYCTTQHCVGVGSGTDALRFALLAAGIGPDSIVLTVPNTFIATTEAISQTGARPDFIDIDERTYNMDPRRLAEYLKTECVVDTNSGEVINRKLLMPVKAIVPVHLYGQTADMDPILELAGRYRLVVIEDACQAHGAEYLSRTGHRLSEPRTLESGSSGARDVFDPVNSDTTADRGTDASVCQPPSTQDCWRKAGSMGLAAAFSFYPGKNLGACGEAGAVTTNDAALAQTVRMLRDHGQSRKYYHEVEGYNGRLDAIQAGILTVKLRHLSGWNASRREAAARYRQLLRKAGVPELAPFVPKWAKSVYHLYVVRVPDRDGFMRHLAEVGIGTGIHYPVPLHLQKAYEWLGYRRGDFPIAEEAAREIVSLPMFPQLAGDEQVRVVARVMAFLSAAELAVP